MSARPDLLRRRLLAAAPLGVVAAAGAGFWFMLAGLQDGSFNPRSVPSALLNRPPPPFDLPPVEGAPHPGLSSADLRAPARPVLVNFWASWCVPCIIEHPQLMALHREGVPIYGISYKDRPADALRFLAERGDPYRRLGADLPGRVAIDWGVYGVPETYLIDRQGLIRWRFAGPITADVLNQDLRPLLRRYA
ncbi:MAG: DsbE family thiol:disulfide interchange protein [Rhodovarius sp.]|nr:DsbE family thiol:disulfide interchange protein [Rhodovarius sp.]MCX7931218.1 DsbE family thiol:disulfide interchange protein [Rhodovarius sp.]MDW8314027.1 DsbE family thiol:disulfide interchange protein [Rhodovarius sp.]